MSGKETNKVAKFHTIEEKEDYVKEESHDLHCQQRYFEHAAARTIEERKETGLKVDLARWTFYQKWLEKNKKGPRRLAPVPPIDDKFPA